MKNPTFFVENKDLFSIISTNFKKIDNIKKISTGWTNIVFEIKNNNVSYILRFPRNEFFSKQIEKDVIVNQFLKNEINLKTTNMWIEYDNNRPYSIHEKVEGFALTEKIKSLSKKEIDKITNEIAEFFTTIHNISLDKIPEVSKIKLSKFLTDLSKVDDNYYNYSSLIDLDKREKEEKVFCHGDLNIGNIILDKNNNINAFIDFAFASLSTRIADLSRISCRVSTDFLDAIIKKYEKINSLTIDMNELQKCNSMWKYIEEQYIIYMKKYQPEIKLPEGL